MGQYFIIVNVSKKQFIDVGRLGENYKFSGVGRGLHGIVLGRLLTSGGDWTKGFYRRYGNPNKDEFYLGVWAGDRIVIAGDYDKPNTNGIQTSTSDDPTLNLYNKADLDPSYEDVTKKVIKWLANDEEMAKKLVERAKSEEMLLRVLSDLVFIENHRTMRIVLENMIGSDWTKLLKESKR